MYVILEDSRKRLSYAPQKWVIVNEKGVEVIYWPKKNQSLLQNDPDSEPVLTGENKWLIVKDTIKRRGLNTKEEAEQEMKHMMAQTQTEEDGDDSDEGDSGSIRQKLQTNTMKETNNSQIPKFVVNSNVALNSVILPNDSPQTKRMRIGQVI